MIKSFILFIILFITDRLIDCYRFIEYVYNTTLFYWIYTKYKYYKLSQNKQMIIVNGILFSGTEADIYLISWYYSIENDRILLDTSEIKLMTPVLSWSWCSRRCDFITNVEIDTIKSQYNIKIYPFGSIKYTFNKANMCFNNHKKVIKKPNIDWDDDSNSDKDENMTSLNNNTSV